MKDNYLNTAQVIAELNISRITLWRWVKKGKIKKYKNEINNNNLFLKRDIMKLKEIARYS